ncbi:MAG: ABC transporter substrate-binding protein, partial [Actinobacteria bacterium]|nr:ABC transporter substrate-binding protein [Actinomycetota bacterium]
MRPTPPISRRRFHRRLLGGLGLPLAAPSLASAASAAAAAAAPADAPRYTPDSVVTLLTALEPPTLVGLVNSAAGTFLVSPKTVEGLLSYDFDLRPRPQLAVAWEVQPDGLQYTFRLRRGVKWHDGRDFSSADVAFSILALKASHPRGRATFASVSEVRTPDAHTAVLVLSKPAPFLLTALAAAESPIVPRHVYEGK